MPPGEPPQLDAEVTEQIVGIITSLAARNPALVTDFATAFAGDNASAQAQLAQSAELASTAKDSELPDLDRSEEASEDVEAAEDLEPEQLESELRALFGIPADQPIVIFP